MEEVHQLSSTKVNPLRVGAVRQIIFNLLCKNNFIMRASVSIKFTGRKISFATYL